MGNLYCSSRERIPIDTPVKFALVPIRYRLILENSYLFTNKKEIEE
jgi:hypothetical protein